MGPRQSRSYGHYPLPLDCRAAKGQLAMMALGWAVSAAVGTIRALSVLTALTLIGGAAPEPLQGEWLYIPPGSEGSSTKLGWVAPQPSIHFDEPVLLCGEGLPPGQAYAFIPVALPSPDEPWDQSRLVTAVVEAGTQVQSITGIRSDGPNSDMLVLMRAGHPFLSLLASGDGARLVVKAPLLEPQFYPLHGLSMKLLSFLAACGLNTTTGQP